jgi:tRNA nucleotidyltransferase (CCA-adding enzyme)
VDAVVSGDAEILARAMEGAGLGRAVPLSRSAPRVFRVAGRREVDLAELAGASIEQDLKRRDFTVNAMAFDLATRQWLDPFGGLKDLAGGRLRAVSAQNLEEDPLRVLRAARFLATHELVPDPETSKACRRVAPRLAEAAAERIRAEWIKMFEARRAAPALRWASRARLLGPALRVGRLQARRLGRAAALFDAPALRRRSPESRRRLRLALMCAQLRLMPGAAAAWLAARRYGRSEAGDVAALLTLASGARAAGSPRGQWSWVRDAGPFAAEALVLLLLLHPASRPRARALSRRVARARPRGPEVSGADVLEWLRIPPGPDVGNLLADLRVEILSGAVRTRREARSWLASHFRGASTAIIRSA